MQALALTCFACPRQSISRWHKNQKYHVLLHFCVPFLRVQQDQRVKHEKGVAVVGRHRNEHRPHTCGIQRRLFSARSTNPSPKARRQTPRPRALLRGPGDITRLPRGAIPKPRPHATRGGHHNGHARPRAILHSFSPAAWDNVRWPQAEVQQNRNDSCVCSIRRNRGIEREGWPNENGLGSRGTGVAFAAVGDAVSAIVDASHGKREPGARVQLAKRLRPEAGQQEDFPPPALWREKNEKGVCKRKGTRCSLQKGARHRSVQSSARAI